MRWGKNSANPGSLTWVRPLHSILCTLGVENEEPRVVEFEVGGINSSNKTFGHRFLAPDEIIVRRFDDYADNLSKAKVIIDAELRKQMILADAKNLAFANGYELVEDAELLDEVSGLVEWPTVLMGEFDAAFLDIPPEVVQLTIRENQKCFVLKSQGETTLINRFLLVSNINASDGGIQIARGNGKVVNARLADAKFFWDGDLAQVASSECFDPWIDKLDLVIFHAKLGTQGAQVRRLMALVGELALPVANDMNEANSRTDLTMKAIRAAQLCKTDLNSAMVYEFPQVQGLMGNIYALRAGEDESVAAAIQAHYKPLGPTDDVPKDRVSVIVALADKLDLLVGFWSVNEKPTGSKDPYALRRAALGVIRLILENELCLPIAVFAGKAFDLFEENIIAISRSKSEVITDLLSFFHDRLKVHLRDKGIRHDLIDAVITPQSDDLLTITRRATALQNLITSDEGANLLAGYKRAANILAAEEKKSSTIKYKINAEILKIDAEIKLNQKMDQVEDAIATSLQKQDYATAMSKMATIRPSVDAFFDNVMVNDEDQDIRKNRFALLDRIRTVTGQVADFSKISG